MRDIFLIATIGFFLAACGTTSLAPVSYQESVTVQSVLPVQIRLNKTESAIYSATTINFAGQTALDNSLDEQLQRALVGEITPADAMRNAAETWRKIVRDKGEEQMVEAIRASMAAWPTIIDKM